MEKIADSQLIRLKKIAEKIPKSHLESFESVHKQLREASLKLAQKTAQLDSTVFYLDRLIENMSQGVLFVNLSGKLTTYNRAAEEILKVPKEAALDHPFLDSFEDNLFGFSMNEVLASRHLPLKPSVTFKSANGEIKELELSPTFDLQGDLSSNGLIILIKDVTEERKAQATALQHRRMEELGKMAAVLAHEIRNPLGGIEGFAALLEKDLEGDKSKQYLASQILEGAKALNQLVSHLLQRVRPKKLQLDKVDLVALTLHHMELLKADSSLPAAISFEFQSPPDLIFLSDKEMLSRALLNLMLNAAQSMPGGGTVKVGVAKDEDRVKITVSDVGIGIPGENLEKIFDPFFSTKPSGTGLGLPETQRVVRELGGEITVVSKIGEGTLFTIDLPFNQAAIED